MKVLVLSTMDATALSTLRQQHDVVQNINPPEALLKTLITNKNVVIFRSGVQLSAEVMACAPNLRLLIRGGSGFDNVDLAYAAQHGIDFMRVPEPGARAVAELSFGLMIGLARQILPMDHKLRGGYWGKRDAHAFTLAGKTLGIIGAGNIGATVGEMGHLWGMHVIGCVGHPSAAEDRRLRERGIHMTGLDVVLQTADFLSIHVPLTAETRGLIGSAELARMKRGAFLVNLARGGVVDEGALRDALVNGQLAGAALDVHANEGHGHVSPLAELDNVILTPHIGASTVDTQREIGERIVDIVARYTHVGNKQAASATVAELVH